MIQFLKTHTMADLSIATDDGGALTTSFGWSDMEVAWTPYYSKNVSCIQIKLHKSSKISISFD